MSTIDLHDIYNYLPLSGRVATAGQPSAEQLARVAQAGYEVVINLAARHSEGALVEEGQIVSRLGMGYLHIPVLWDAPTSADFARFAAALARHRQQTLFIHCIANKRVSAFVLLYRVLRLSWPLALAHPDLARIWAPEGVWRDYIEQMLAC